MARSLLTDIVNAVSEMSEWEEVHECRMARSLLTDIVNAVSETGSGRVET